MLILFQTKPFLFGAIIEKEKIKIKCYEKIHFNVPRSLFGL